jgi:hypothetical protein
LLTLLLQGSVDAPIVPPAIPFPLAPPVNEVLIGATPPFTVTVPKVDEPPLVPLSGVNPVALSEFLLPLQLINAAAPPAPTVIDTELPGVNVCVPKETPPPPAPAP